MEQFNPMEIFLARLAKEIEQLHNSLQSYLNRPNASPIYIQKQQEHIERLVDIYNGLEAEYNKLSFLYPLSQPFMDIQQCDPELGRIIFQVQIKPNNSNCGLISLNPFM